MKVTIVFYGLKKGALVSIRKDSTIEDVIKKVGGIPADFIVAVKDKKVNLDTKTKEGMKILLIPKADSNPDIYSLPIDKSKIKTSSVKKFEIGGMWEFSEWKIVINKECSSFMGIYPCKHCHSLNDVEDSKRKEWICPRVVVAENECGYNSTGICLDCILEAAKKLK